MSLSTSCRFRKYSSYDSVHDKGSLRTIAGDSIHALYCPRPSPPMIEFQLFRLKMVRPSQTSVFHAEWSNVEFLTEAISSRKTAELRRGHFWHIGNQRQVTPSGWYFALGRTTRASLSSYDEKTGNFIEQEFETAPYTHVLVDVDLGLCGIARKYQLAQYTPSIARQLGKLLNQTGVLVESGTHIDVVEISDPDEFIQLLESSAAVLSFSVTFSRPNPFDVNRDFQLPMERYLQEADGNAGKTTIRGEQLHTDVLVDMTRSAASTGNDASAVLRTSLDSRPVRRSLRARAVTVVQDALDEAVDMLEALGRLRSVYLRIRGRENDE